MIAEIIQEILSELSTYSLIPSNYHRKLNCGSCHTFGLTTRRGLPPQVSQVSSERAKLYKSLVQLGDALGVSGYTSISLYHNYTLVRRKEKQGGVAHLVLLGEYSDKGIQILGQEGNIETLHTAIPLNTKTDCLVSSPVLSGDRYLVLYHRIGEKDYLPVFTGSGNSISLVCGEDQPLSANRLSFWREEKEVRVSFD